MFPQWRWLEQARFLPHYKREMFMPPEGTHHILLAGVCFSTECTVNLGVRAKYKREF